jgi:HEAT repeat protein
MKLMCMLLACAVLSAAPAVTDYECTEMLRQGLVSGNPDTRKMAVAALSLAAIRGSLYMQLEGMMNDKDVQVRLAVVAGLAELKTKEAKTALETALEDSVPEVSFAAAKALWTLDDPEGKKALLSVLEGESKTASSFFSKQKRDALRMMHTPGSTFIYVIRQGAGFAPIPGLGMGISSMQQILVDPGTSGRAAAALLLAKDKDPATLEALKDALYDRDWHVRAAAVHALALRDDPRLREDLEPLTADDKEGVRLRAAAAILRLSAIRSGARPNNRAPQRKKSQR